MGRRSCFALLLAVYLVPTIAAAQSPSPSKDIPTIAKSAKGAIVTIVMANDDKPLALGTGFLVKSDGEIITNYHVIESGNVAMVKFADGTILPVDGVLASDKTRDLAVIKIHGRFFRTLNLGNSDQIAVGEEVVAIGNPEGFELTVSNGILSGVRTDKEAGGKFLQITAPITHGNSGGPLFNMKGEVVGITTLGFAGSGNLNFAVPVNDAKYLLSREGRLLPLPDDQPREQATSGGRNENNNDLREQIGWLQAKTGHRNENSDELKETLQWMLDTLPEGSLECLKLEEGAQAHTTCFQAEIRKFSGCRVEFNLTRSQWLKTRSENLDMPSFNVLDLGNIDSERISSRSVSLDSHDYAAFELFTWNDRKTILHIDVPDNTLLNKLSFLLKTDYRVRFEKAFRHAVDLCGGKPSSLTF